MSVPSVGPTEVSASAVLVDVRNYDEWSAGHVPDSLHVPMGEFIARYEAELPRDRDLVLVCKVGSRSAQVAAYLRQHGWDNAQNLDGGLVAWERAGKELVTDSGAAPAVL